MVGQCRNVFLSDTQPRIGPNIFANQTPVQRLLFYKFRYGHERGSCFKFSKCPWCHCRSRPNVYKSILRNLRTLHRPARHWQVSGGTASSRSYSRPLQLALCHRVPPSFFPARSRLVMRELSEITVLVRGQSWAMVCWLWDHSRQISHALLPTTFSSEVLGRFRKSDRWSVLRSMVCVVSTIYSMNTNPR